MEETSWCYIATAVYGSYDCPNVWVLRRFRDYFLSKSLFGRLFIAVYYKTSPILIKLVGRNKLVIGFWKMLLDPFVLLQKSRGYEDSVYEDTTY